LVAEAALRNSASQILAQASDAKAIYATPPLAYALTTTAGPVQPGQGIQFTVTVTNLSTVSQYVTLNYDVPQFTSSGGYTAGTGLSYVMGYVTAGATQVVSLDFKVLSGTQAPPAGSLIFAMVSDRVHGALVSSSVTVRSAPAPVLNLSTPQNPVTPGANFTYTLAYHNGSASTLSGAGLSVPVPVGASFVSADGGGTVGLDGAVHWTLSALAANASGEVNLNLKASTTTGARPPLLVEAALRNSASQILAQASDAKAVYATPPLAYALTATAGPVQPGQGFQFTVTVTNLSTVSQYVTLNYDVPQFTTSGGYTAGTGLSYVMGYVTAGATQVVSLDFTVLSGSQAPPDGSLITAVVSDRVHGGLVSSSLAVRSTPAAVLDLSTPQSPVAPGANFTYTLAYHNGTASTLSGAGLSVPVPVGASFVSADGGGAVGSDGMVHWTLSALAANASGEVNLTLKASTTTGTRPPLLVEAALRNSASQILAQASDAKAVYASPPLAYALTATAGPVQPGQGIEFTVTVTNLSTVSQYVTLNYDVPQFTTSGGYTAGTGLSYVMGYVTAGATQVVSLDFKVLSGSQAPPDGSLITAVVSDRIHGGLVSSTLAVRSTPAANLDLSTPQSPLAPGGNFIYTLAYHNGTASALSGAELTVPVPVGASFVSADGGGAVGSDGAVHWTLSTLAANASGGVNLNLKASTATGARPPVLVEAALRNSLGQILAQASDAKAIYVTPPLSYALTTTADPAQPGQGIEFLVTLTNLSTATQYVTLNYDVPQFTTEGGYAAGTNLSYVVGNVTPGASQVVSLSFTVLSGSQAPPDGSLVTLVVSDRVHGALVSSSLTVRSTPPATLALSTQHGPVTPGSGFAYTLAYHNAAGSALSGAQLTLPLPVGASFVSADGGGKLGSDGAVHWALSALAASATGEVHLNLAASSATAARPPLLLQAALRNSASQILAQASDAKAIYLSPPLTYALTTTTDPARSGQAAQFTVSVTNVSKAVQYVTLNYDVPQFTTDGGYVAGTSLTYVIGNVAVGATQNVALNFTVLSGSQTPSNGSLITLVVADLTHGATISRSVAVNQTLAMLHQAALFRGELAWAAPATKTGGIPVLWPRR
jgi:hypothetical protein